MWRCVIATVSIAKIFLLTVVTAREAQFAEENFSIKSVTHNMILSNHGFAEVANSWKQ